MTVAYSAEEYARQQAESDRIAGLPPEEQARLWQEQLAAMPPLYRQILSQSRDATGNPIGPNPGYSPAPSMPQIISNEDADRQFPWRRKIQPPDQMSAPTPELQPSQPSTGPFPWSRPPQSPPAFGGMPPGLSNGLPSQAQGQPPPFGGGMPQPNPNSLFGLSHRSSSGGGFGVSPSAPKPSAGANPWQAYQSSFGRMMGR